jgi:hypothetical protein
MFEQYNIENIYKKKRVKFHNIISVILIQSKEEYEKNILWWSLDDLHCSHNSSIFELKRLMKRHYTMTLFQAKKLLYQPFCYDPSNFN